MARQFTTRGMARGTRLTTQHVYQPLQDAKAALDSGTVDGLTVNQAPVRMTWTIPFLNSAMFETTDAAVTLPFAAPPLQEDWTVELQPPTNQLVLTELSLSWDQRAEPLGITDQYCTDVEGLLSKPDMSRYTLALSLVEQPLSILDPNPAHWTTVWSSSIDGVGAWANLFFRQNPIQINNLSIPLNPYRSYSWVVQVPGLYTANKALKDRLAMPNFTLSALGQYPLVARDVNLGTTQDPTVQNLPTKHNGAKNTGTLALTVPSANALIDGDSDLQAGFRAFDQRLLSRLNSGYGAGSGGAQGIAQEQDAPPWEQLARDSGYSTIVVPMWSTMGAVRASDYATAGYPYLAASTGPTQDRRVIRVPSGFTVHHILVGWNLYSPPTTTTKGQIGWGTGPSDVHFVNRVGVGICNGLRADDYHYQQVGYLEWDISTMANWQISALSLDGTHINHRLLNMPLVHPLAPPWSNHSYTDSGEPFYLGGGNSTTSSRTWTCSMPGAFGGLVKSAPATGGTDTWLEVRWEMQDQVNGLDDAGHPDDVRIGQGGHWVVIVGKQALTY